MLAGLGASLCVQPVVANGPKVPNPPGLNFPQLLALVSHPKYKPNIEALMSRCRVAESCISGTQKEALTNFVVLAEGEFEVALGGVTAQSASTAPQW